MNMRISIANIFTHLFLLLALLATASCSDWTDQKTVDIDPQHAKEQNLNFGLVTWRRCVRIGKANTLSLTVVSTIVPKSRRMKVITSVHCPTHWTS